MEVPQWVIWICLVVLFIMQIVSLTRCCGGSTDSTSATRSESEKNITRASAITKIGVFSGIATLILGIAAYIYLADTTTYARPYVMFMVHASLLVSIISSIVSISLKLQTV